MTRIAKDGCFAAVLALSIAYGADAQPTFLDSEEKAADAAFIVGTMERSLEFDLDAITLEPRVYLQESLSQLATRTTPNALGASRSGLTIPCEFGGYFRATATRTRPRVVEIDWADCVAAQQTNYRKTLTGPIQVTLLSDTFEPAAVAVIRAGNESIDLTITDAYTDPSWPQVNSSHYKYRMTGLISMRRLLGTGPFIGYSTFHLHGFTRATTEAMGAPVPGSRTTSAENVLASVSRAYSDDNRTANETVQIMTGTLSHESDMFSPHKLRRYAMQDFRTTHFLDFYSEPNGSSEHTINGGVRVANIDGYTPECSGTTDYRIRTRVPVHTSLLFVSAATFDRGEIAINNAVVRYYSSQNIPAGLPVPTGDMLTTIDVKDLGMFAYDSDFNSPDNLYQVAKCF